MNSKILNWQVNRFDLFFALYIFCILVSEMMGIKTFSLLNLGIIKLNASVAILLIPLVFTLNDSIIEVYGVGRAKSVYRSGLLMVVFLILFSALAIKLPPSERFQASENAYELIFGQSIRIAIASLTAFAFSDFMDIVIFHNISRRLGKKNLWLRSNLSNFISQFFDTVVFMSLAFYAWERPLADNFSFLTSLIIPYWLLKCFMSVMETPFVYLGVKWLKGEKK